MLLIKYFLPLLCIVPGIAQIQGIVVDMDTQSPIEGARVRIHKALPFAETDASGFFSLDDATAPPFDLVAGAHGYYNGSTFVTSETTGLTIQLEAVPTQPDGDHELFLPTDCQGCHESIYDEWLGSPMQKTGLNAWVFDVYDGNGTAGGMGGFVYQRDSVHFPQNFNSDCSACHSPVHWLKTFEIDPPVQTMGSLDEINQDMRNGVQCEICHRAYDVDIDQTHVPGVQPETFHLLDNDAPVQFGLLGDAIYEQLGIMRGAYNPQLSGQLCSACHEDTVDVDDDGDFSPEDGSLDHETTFSEWRTWQDQSPDNVDTCVTCHMPASPRTSFCIFEPEDRLPFSSRNHDIRGTTPEFLENALTLDVTPKVGFDRLTVDVRVENVGAGHAVPTGVVIRNVILLVTPRDGNGDRLAQLEGDRVDFIGGVGDPDEGYYADLPGQAFYRNYETALGEQGVFYTEAVAQVHDTRIPPGGQYTGTFSFALDGADEVDLAAELIYRRSFRHLVDAKQWTETGHGEPLADIQPPYFGHLMADALPQVDYCATRDVDDSGSVDLTDIRIIAGGWLGPAPFAADEVPRTSIRHLAAAVSCR